jgi:hypothetical protein
MHEIKLKGIYRDRLIQKDGLCIYDSAWQSNLIALRCRILLAAFMGADTTALGIRSMQVGQGDATWDTTPPPVPDPNSISALVDPSPYTIPHTSLVFEYLDDTDNVVSVPTNRLQITATLGIDQPTPATDPPYPLREFGLFGELDGTPYMIDYIRHPLIEKDGVVTLERKVRLIF